MADALPGKRLLVVEEALKDFSGHWYEYVRAVVALNQGRGVDVTVVGHARAGDALRGKLGVRPVFAKTLWDGDYRRGWAPLRKLSFLRHNLLVFRRMRAFLRDNGPFDCVFVPTVVAHHAWAWWLLWQLQRRSIGRLVLLIRNSVATYPADGSAPRFGLGAAPLKHALRAFAGEIAGGRVVVATDSARLATEYAALAGIAAVVFPSPRTAPVTATRAPHADGAIVFACLGPARLEKGIDVLQRAIALYLAEPAHPPARFVVQWNTPVIDGRGAAIEPDPALTTREEVRFLRDELDSDQYDRTLGETGCMVLPYRRAAYFARISGVAVEAVTAGIPIVCTEGTWTAELVRDSGAGIAVADGDAPAVAAAMIAIARDYPRYRGEAEARTERALAAHSGDVFLDKLWG